MNKKMVLSAVLMIAMVFSVTIGAGADMPAVETGEVISQNISLRVDHSTGASKIRDLHNGDTFEILDRWDQWLYIAYFDPHKVETLNGWVLNYYVPENPMHITLRNSNTPAYAYPSSDSKRVGSLTKYTRLTVIAQLDRYWVVSLREAAACIPKSARVWLDEELDNWSSVVSAEATVLNRTTTRTGPGTNWYSVQTLNAGAVVEVLGMDGDWCIIRYKDAIAYIKAADISY